MDFFNHYEKYNNNKKIKSMEPTTQHPLDSISNAIASKLEKSKKIKSFEEYHAENPMVWSEFERMTFKMMSHGFPQFSAKGIFELIRWWGKGKKKSDGFKVNNTYTPYYADMFMKIHPEHKGFFETRERKSN